MVSNSFLYSKILIIVFTSLCISIYSIFILN
nr:MAG TPA: hypothetical protein [Bacteriophage sp.]